MQQISLRTVAELIDEFGTRTLQMAVDQYVLAVARCDDALADAWEALRIEAEVELRVRGLPVVYPAPQRRLYKGDF